MIEPFNVDQVAEGTIAEADEFEDDDALYEREESHGDDGETESEWHERPRVRPRTSDRA